MRQNEEWQGREQLGPQLGYKAIIDQVICKGSVAHLVRRQTFCAGGSESKPVNPLYDLIKFMLSKVTIVVVY